MMQLVLIVLTKRKETVHNCESFGYGGITLSNIAANDLMHVSVPTEDRSIISTIGISLHPPSWTFHFIPIMDISQQ
jgi:hypothetical protein